MAMNIKSAQVETLVAQIAKLTGDSKTEVIRKALAEKKIRLAYRIRASRASRLRNFLQQEAWPAVPRRELGRKLTRAEEEDILGYGSEGV